MPLPIFIAVLLLVGWFFAVEARRKRTAGARTWNELVQQLQPVHAAGVHQLADAYLHPRKNQVEIEPAAMFEMVGGMKGVESIRSNAKIILALASYAIEWNEVEATIVAEMIRRDAVRLRRAAMGLQWSMLRSKIRASAPFQLQEIAASYHLMTFRLLALYETSHSARYPVLAAAL
jgi:hypothetical protein